MAGEPDLFAIDVVMVIQDGDVVLAEVAVRSHDRFVRIKPIEKGLRKGEALGDFRQGRAHFSDVEGGIEVQPQHIQVSVLIEVSAGHLTDQEEVVFAQSGSELLDRPAEVASALKGHMLERVNAKSITVRQGDPVLVALSQKVQRVRPATAFVLIQIEVSQVEKICTLVLCVVIFNRSLAEVAGACARIAARALKFLGPHAIIRSRNLVQRLLV